MNEGEVVIDYGSITDLGGDDKDDPKNITIEQAKGLFNQLRYFKQHPKEDVRMAYKFFVYAVLLGILSIVIGVVSIIATIFEWKVGII